MSEVDPIFKELLKANLITNVYDAQLNKNSYALTPKGADWYRLLASLFNVPQKRKTNYFDKIAKVVNKNAPDKVIKNTKKETINKVGNKVIDVMEGIAKFGQQIDRQTGGAPKLTRFQQGDIGAKSSSDFLSPPSEWGVSKPHKKKRKKSHARKTRSKR